MSAALKIISKKQKVRNMIFDRKKISRQELLALSGLNERTIVRYTEELKAQKLITETHDNSRRGRPGVIFHSNSETVFFAGLHVRGRYCVFSAININAIPLACKQLVYNPEQTPSDLVSLILEHFTIFLEELRKEFTLCSIGVSLATGELKRGLISMLQIAVAKRYPVQAEFHDSDDLLLGFLADTHMLHGRTGGIYGKENFGMIVMENDEVLREYDGYLKKLRHFRIDAGNAVKCYCGRIGCVDAVLCYSGLQTRYAFYSGQKRENISDVAIVNNLYLKAHSGDVHAMRVVQEHGRMLGEVALKISRELNLDQIVLRHTKSETKKSAAESYAALAKKEDAPLLFSNFTEVETSFASALLVRRRLLEYQKYEI